MKKTIVLGLILILIASTVSALFSPEMVKGNVIINGDAVSGIKVEITNTQTGQTLDYSDEGSLKTEGGIFFIFMDRFQDRYEGQEYKVSICSSLPECTITFKDEGNYPKEINFNIGSKIEDTDIEIVPEPEPTPPPRDPDVVTITEIIYKCADGREVKDRFLCGTVISKVCIGGKEVGPDEECPFPISEELIGWIIGLFTVLIAAYGGWKGYNGKFKHYHRGNVSYHDPLTQHRNPKYRHAPFKMGSYWKCLSDIKKIQNGIDLSKG